MPINFIKSWGSFIIRILWIDRGINCFSANLTFASGYDSGITMILRMQSFIPSYYVAIYFTVNLLALSIKNVF